MKKTFEIEKIKNEIIQALKPLEPKKIILFGSYAYGNPDEESDIDIFLIKDNLKKEHVREEMIRAQRLLWDLVKKYHIGFDVLVDSSDRVNYRIEQIRDQFYEEIFKRGKVIYGQ